MKRIITGILIVLCILLALGCPNPTVDPPKSDNAHLGMLEVKANNVSLLLSPVFDPHVFTYSLKIPNELDSIELSYAAEDANSSITGFGPGTYSISGTGISITINLRSQDSSVTNVYRIDIGKSGVAGTYYEHLFDDGSKDMNFAPKSAVAGGELGNVFSLGSDVRKLNDVSIFASRAGTGVLNEAKLNVYSIRNGDYLLVDSVLFTPTADNAWTVVDLRGENIFINGDVLVAVEWLTATGTTSPYASFFIGGDMTAATVDRALWKVPGGTFQPSSTSIPGGAIMNLMVRLGIGNY